MPIHFLASPLRCLITAKPSTESSPTPLRKSLSKFVDPFTSFYHVPSHLPTTFVSSPPPPLLPFPPSDFPLEQESLLHKLPFLSSLSLPPLNHPLPISQPRLYPPFHSTQPFPPSPSHDPRAPAQLITLPQSPPSTPFLRHPMPRLISDLLLRTPAKTPGRRLLTD